MSLVVGGARIAHGAGELEGQIRGKVLEAATDAPVPGATVSVTSPSLGDPRVVTTDEDGAFLVPNLPLGHYRVAVSYPGVKPIIREIAVQPGVTSPMEIKWSAELAEAETTTVVEERPLTNPDSTQTGATISNDQQRYIPTGRRYTDAVLLVPGVTPTNTSTDAIIKGGRSAQNKYLIDGLDVTDPVSHTAQQLLAFDSIDAVQVITSGFDAEYNVFGGVINTITREGSDEWHGSVSAYGTNASLDNRKAEGLSSNERDRVFDESPQAPTYTYIATGTLGGPIIKHRLWFNATFEYRYAQTGKLVGPPMNLPPPPQTNVTLLPRLKISYAPSSKQRLSLSLAADPQTQDNDRPQAASQGMLPLYQKYTEMGGYNAILSWSIFPSSSFEFRLDAGIKHQYVNTGPRAWFGRIDYTYCEMFSPRNCQYEKDTPTHVNGDDNSTWYNADTDVSFWKRNAVQIDPKITLRGRWLGEHTAKIGIQYQYLRNSRSLHQTGNFKYADKGGGPLEDGLCDPDNGKTLGCDQRNSSADRNMLDLGYGAGLFLQDHWQLLPWVTLTPGIRFDYGRARTTNGYWFQSDFAVGPRMGLIVDVTRDQRTIFSTSYGRSNAVVDIGNASSYDNIIQGAKRTDKWVRTPPPGHWEFFSQVGGEGGGILKETSIPHADQITTSIRREIYRNTVIGLEHTYKRIVSTWDSVETNAIWDPTGYRVIDYVDGTPHEITLYTTPANNVRNYNGFTLSLEGRPTPNWYFLGSYTLSWLYGTAEFELTSASSSGILSSNAHRIPQQWKFQNGFLPEDNRHQLNVAGSYTFHGFTIGVHLQYISGAPKSKFFNATDLPDTSKNISYRSPRGTNPGTCSGSVPGQGSFNPATTVCGNNIGLIAEYRLPPRGTADLHLEYDFYQLLHQHISLSYDIFNIFNDRSPNNLQENDAPAGTFGQVTGRQTALNMRLGARYDF
jgi:hypothetical protein